MLAPLFGTLILTQLFGSLKGGPGEAYNVEHGGIWYRCIGHPGVDFDCPVGSPVRAMKGGTLQTFGASGLPDDGYGALGMHAVITLPTGEQHWYGHLSLMLADPEDVIDGGAIFAHSGNTGVSSGPHLHTAVRPPVVDYANLFDGFVCFMTHFGHNLAGVFDLSRV